MMELIWRQEQSVLASAMGSPEVGHSYKQQSYLHTLLLGSDEPSYFSPGLGTQDRQCIFFIIIKPPYSFLIGGSGLERCQPDYVTSQVQCHGDEEDQMAPGGPAELRGTNLS